MPSSNANASPILNLLLLAIVYIATHRNGNYSDWERLISEAEINVNLIHSLGIQGTTAPPGSLAEPSSRPSPTTAHPNLPHEHTRIRIFSPPGDATLILLNLATPLQPVNLEITLNADTSAILDFSGPTEDLRAYLLSVPYAISSPRHPLFSLMVLVDSSSLPRIIGRSGVHANRMRQQLGHPRSFTVENATLPDSTEQLVRIIGRPDLVLNIVVDRLFNTATPDNYFVPENSMTISKLTPHN